MADPLHARPRADKGLPTLAADLWELVVAYARQETLDPVKGLVRFVGWGVAGSVALGLGLVMVALALLRALQTETDTTFGGNLSWLPYLITLVVCVAVAALAARAIGSPKRKAARKGSVA